MDEVRAALKKMKRHKAPGLSGLVTEMIQATGDTGTQWILDCTSRNLVIFFFSSSLIAAVICAFSFRHCNINQHDFIVIFSYVRTNKDTRYEIDNWS